MLLEAGQLVSMQHTFSAVVCRFWRTPEYISAPPAIAQMSLAPRYEQEILLGHIPFGKGQLSKLA
jgi:hypothetical protein